MAPSQPSRSEIRTREEIAERGAEETSLPEDAEAELDKALRERFPGQDPAEIRRECPLVMERMRARAQMSHEGSLRAKGSVVEGRASFRTTKAGG